MDIINNSNCMNGGNNCGSGGSLKAKNFQTDSDNNSSHSFNSISSTPNSLISTPSPSSTDNTTNSFSGSSTHYFSQASNQSINDNNLNLLLKQYSLMPNNGTSAPLDTISHFLNSDSGNVLNGYYQELNNRMSNGLVNKNQNKSNSNNSNSSGSNRKKPSSNNSPNSAGSINSKTNSNHNNNSTIPPGLHNFINNKSSIMVNGQAIQGKPKNLRSLMTNKGIMNNNNKARLANGEIGNNVGNKLNDNLYSPVNNMSLNNLQSTFNQAQQQQPHGFNSFHLSNGESLDFPFNRSDSNNFLSNANNHTWVSNLKSGQDHTPSTFDELFGSGGANSFKNSDTSSILSNSSGNGSHSGNKFSINQNTNTAGEIGAGLKNGNNNYSASESLLAELSIPKRDIWLHGNESSPNSQLSSFFDNANSHTQDIITSSASAVNSISTSTTNVPSNSFENVWSNSALNAFNSWPDFPSFSNFSSNNSSSLESSNNLTNLTATNEFDVKKLLAMKSEKLSSLLDSTTTFDMKGRTQINEIMAMFKKYILEMIITQDIHLCSTNFDNYYDMVKSDLAKFEASTFTIEELKIFQEIYTTLLQSKEKFNEDKQTIENDFEQFTTLVKNLVLSSAAGSIFMFDESLLRKIADKLANAFNVLYSAKYNNIFLNLVKFYKKMIYSIPSEILNNLPLIIQQSKMLSDNTGNLSDPLFLAYRNFINELNKYNNHNRHNFPHNNEEDEVDSVDETLLNNIKNNSGDMISENKDVNNNKKIDNMMKDCNKISNENEIDIKLKAISKQQQTCLNNKAPPIFSHVSQIKNEPSVYMSFYYPVDHNMLNINGPISIFCNRIKVKSPYYMSPNRQTFEYIVEGELSKALPGTIVLEKSENLTTNKSFNKLVGRLRKHFPNLSIKQLVELAIQSKYAIMKKHKHQYGFSGFKIKDLVKYIVEYICENAIPLSVPNSDAMKGVSSAAAAALAAKGVSWSMVASASNQPNGQLMMSPSTSGTKDSASVVSSASPSPSPSLMSNPSTPQICALCKNIVTNNTTDEKRKMAIIACSHIFHKECIDFWTKLNPVCPLCDQFILRNEEFPSLV